MPRTSLFGAKDKTKGERRYQGILTKRGATCFEQARAKLTRLAQTLTNGKAAPASDGDTIEFLARGEAETLQLFARKR